MTFEVRRCRLQDIEKLMELAAQFFAESDFSDLTYDPALFKRHMVEYATRPDCALITAWISNLMVGYVVITATREFTAEPIGEMYQFYVMPEYRGTGASRELVKAADAQWQAWGCCRSYSEAAPGMSEKNNKLFANLWKKQGYKDTGIIMIKEYR